VRNDVVGKTEEIRVTLMKTKLLEVAYTPFVTIAECSLIAGNFPNGTKINDFASVTLPFVVPVPASEDDALAFCVRVGIKNNTATAADVMFVGATVQIEYRPIDLRI